MPIAVRQCSIVPEFRPHSVICTPILGSRPQDIFVRVMLVGGAVLRS